MDWLETVGDSHCRTFIYRFSSSECLGSSDIGGPRALMRRLGWGTGELSESRLKGEVPPRQSGLNKARSRRLSMRPRSSQGRLERKDCAAKPGGALGPIATGKVLFRLVPPARAHPQRPTSTLDRWAFRSLGASTVASGPSAVGREANAVFSHPQHHHCVWPSEVNPFVGWTQTTKKACPTQRLGSCFRGDKPGLCVLRVSTVGPQRPCEGLLPSPRFSDGRAEACKRPSRDSPGASLPAEK